MDNVKNDEVKELSPEEIYAKKTKEAREEMAYGVAASVAGAASVSGGVAGTVSGFPLVGILSVAITGGALLTTGATLVSDAEYKWHNLEHGKDKETKETDSEKLAKNINNLEKRLESFKEVQKSRENMLKLDEKNHVLQKSV